MSKKKKCNPLSVFCNIQNLDELLFETNYSDKVVYWRPGIGKRIAPQSSKYQHFGEVVRTVHIEDAIHICRQHRIPAKPIVNNRFLCRYRLTDDHPCKNIKVVWFGIQTRPNNDKYDWYGNIQFSFPVEELRRRWKYCFLVELMQNKNSSTSRMLITNTDYSDVFQKYDPTQIGGPWFINSEGHFVLLDCRRFGNEGQNKYGHILEFMIEATKVDQKYLLQISKLSFRNHSEATENKGRQVKCQRSTFTHKQCYLPLTSIAASRVFFDLHQRMSNDYPLASPRLSGQAEHLRQSFVKMRQVIEDSHFQYRAFVSYINLKWHI